MRNVQWVHFEIFAFWLQTLGSNLSTDWDAEISSETHEETPVRLLETFTLEKHLRSRLVWSHCCLREWYYRCEMLSRPHLWFFSSYGKSFLSENVSLVPEAVIVVSVFEAEDVSEAFGLVVIVVFGRNVRERAVTLCWTGVLWSTHHGRSPQTKLGWQSSVKWLTAQDELHGSARELLNLEKHTKPVLNAAYWLTSLSLCLQSIWVSCQPVFVSRKPRYECLMNFHEAWSRAIIVN